MSATPRTADYAWTTLARVLSVAKDRGRIAVNVCERGGRLYKADRSEKIWTVDDIAKFKAFAPKELRLALMMAFWTGQRQGDLLRAPWSAYDGKNVEGSAGQDRGAGSSPNRAATPRAIVSDSERRLDHPDQSSWQVVDI